MRRRCEVTGVICGLIVMTSVITIQATEFHATPGGSPRGNGSATEPWDLGTALVASEIVKPGDTVWIHAGTYRGGFVSRLSGRPGNPVVVRGERSGRVTIDTHPRDDKDNGQFLLLGADTVYRDFEVTCSHPQRETKIAGPWPADIRRGDVDVRGDRIAVVNLVVHDCGSGFGFWAEGEGGNIAFENGCLTHKGDNAPGILVGGGSAAERIAVRDNVIVGGGMRLGYPWGTTNEDVVCTGNYTEGLVVRDFRKATVRRNTVVASSTVVSLEGADRLLLGGLRWNENDYYVTDGRWGECSVVESSKSRGLSFTEWRETTGLDAKSTFTKGAPSKLRIIVRPNAYEPGRAHLAVLNPQKLSEVEVDLSRVLKSGQRFRVLSVKNVFGESLVSGLYDDRPVRIPMKPSKPPPPIGMPNAELPVTEPQFAVFVVLPE